MVPGEDGLSICRRLRAASAILIIVVTARSADVDRVVGLDIGADDYVTKPFNSRELIVRIRAPLRHAQGRRDSRHLRTAGVLLAAGSGTRSRTVAKSS
jgi:two-component system, OmpR family, response regulator